MPKNTEPTAFVLSQDCTHVLADEGVELLGGEVTLIPLSLLERCLELPGVVQAFPHDMEA